MSPSCSYSGPALDATYQHISERPVLEDEADRVIVALEDDVVQTHPSAANWEFNTDTAGIIAVEDLRNIGPTLAEQSVNGNTLYFPSILATNPDRFQAAQLDDGESYEIPIQIPDGDTLEVYRWGAYDSRDNTADSGLSVELLDGVDVVQQSERTTNTQDETVPVAAHVNSTESECIFTLRAKKTPASRSETHKIIPVLVCTSDTG